MYKFSTLEIKYLSFRQLFAVALMLMIGVAEGQVSPDATTLSASRAPASYIPDDDLIVKPVDNQLSFYQQYVASDNSEQVIQNRNQLKVWNDNQVFAEQYGMDSTLTGSPFYVPTQDEKLEYFKSKYMRYLRGKGEQPIKEMPRTWYQNYRASNEVDTIDEMEGRFKQTQSKTYSGKDLPEALREKEIGMWKKTRFIFQPRLDQGLVILGVKGPVYARAWVGVNGRAEFNVQKEIKESGTRFMWNYYADTGRYFTSLDQRLMEHVYARVTSQENPEASDALAKKQDNTFMLLYTRSF